MNSVVEQSIDCEINGTMNPDPALVEQDYDIAIIGMAGRFPGAANVQAFWENLCAGQEGITFFSDEELQQAGVPDRLLNDPNYVKAAGVIGDRDQFDAPFFGFSAKEAVLTDPQHRLFLEEAWTALEHAGYNPDTYEGAIGVYAGVGTNTYLLNYLYPSLVAAGGTESYQALIRNDKDFLPTLVSYKLNLRGPSLAVQTACSTSLVAVHLACQSLLSGECDMAMAGGATVMANPTGHLYQEGMIMSPDGHCRAFDAQAQGTVGGSGVGVVILKRLTDAIAEGDTIHAVIKGSAINNDGSNKVGYTAPSVEGQAAVITEAQAVAGVSADTIAYVEAHGTGTTLGDPIELTALTQAFRQQTNRTGFCAIGSVKTNIGHLDTAAGVAGLIKTVAALKNGALPPSLHFQQPNPALNFASSPFYVNTKLQPWPKTEGPKRAGVSSFGIGGTNAHVILEEAPEQPIVESDHSHHLLVLSARSKTALAQQSQQLADYLERHLDGSLADVAYTLSVGRKPFEYRRTVICQSIPDAIEHLRSDEAGNRSQVNLNIASEVAFLFSGQGTQYVGMGYELYQTEPMFRDALDECAQLLQPILNQDIRHCLYPTPAQIGQSHALLQQTALTQPILFAVEYALAQLWLAWGIKPTAMLGHSVGEYVAACIAGVFSLPEALWLMAHRGHLMQQLPPGAMLAVSLSEVEIQPWLSTNLELAAVNGTGCTVAGSVEAIDQLQSQLEAQQIPVKRLKTSHAFHSSLLEPMLESFGKLLDLVKFHPPQIPYVSNVTGTWITAAEATSPRYWLNHARQTVRFADGLATLLQAPNRILLEVGPGRSLAGLAQKHPDFTTSHTILTSLHPPQQMESDRAILLRSIATLWASGGSLNWAKLYSTEQRRRIPLPTYPFERQRYWVEATDAAFQSFGAMDLGRKPDLSDWFYIPTWTRTPLPPQSNDHSPQTWLVFLDLCGVGLALCQRLQAQGDRVITVALGDRWYAQDETAYSLNPAIAEDYVTLFETLKAADHLPDQIVHCWTVTAPALDPFAPQMVSALLDRGLHSLLGLVRAIGKVCPLQPIRLSAISNGLQEITGQETLSPIKATLISAIKVIPQEYPPIQCRSVDLDWYMPTTTPPNLLEQLWQELGQATPIDTPVVAYRGRFRWRLDYEAVTLPATEKPLQLRQQGVYLITGGFGGIGLTLAQYLAKTVRAKLVLVQRSALLPQAQWQQWLNTHAADDATSLKIRAVQQLEAQGAQVLVVAADVTDETSLRQALQTATQRFGPCHGVLHCAGIADFAGIIQSRSRADTDQILASKLQGTLNLYRCLQGQRLDFLMLSSSLSTILYKTLFGQVGYGAANEFLNAFAAYHALHHQIQTVAIDWTEWKEVGMAVAARQQRRQTEEEDWLIGLTPKEGQQVFERILSAPYPQIAVSIQDLSRLLAQQASWNMGDLLNQDPATPDPAQPKHARPSLASSYVAPASSLEQQLTELWEAYLGVAPIGLQDDFFELGGDSLLAIGLLNQMQKRLSITVPLTILVETPTIAQLAAYLYANYPEAVTQLAASPAQPIETSAAAPATIVTGNSTVTTNGSATTNGTVTTNGKVQFQPTPENGLAIHANASKSSSHPLTPSPPHPLTQPDGSLLLRLHAGREKTTAPLFLMHPIGGGVTCYGPLVQALQLDRPVYGIQAVGLSGENPPLQDLRQIATRYIAEMKQIQPQGPYFLGGWSMGGVTAFEMTRQLHRNGDSVQSLVLIDSPPPTVLNPLPDLAEQLHVFCRSLGFSWKQSQQVIKSLAPVFHVDTAVMQQVLEQGKQIGVLPKVLDFDTLNRFWQVFAANTQALHEYMSAGCVLPPSTLLLLAKDAEQKGLLLVRSESRVTDHQTETQWRQLLGARLQAKVVAGDHYSMVTANLVRGMAQTIHNFLPD